MIVLIGGIVLSGIGYLVNYGYARVDAVLSSNIMALTPVFASIIAFIIFHEFPSNREIVGSIVIIVSAILLNYSDRQNDKT